MCKTRLLLLFTFIVLFSVAPLSAQSLARDLNGFRLGQYRAATHREFGDPGQQGSMDGDLIYEAFLIKEEPMLYMVFQYQESEPEVIWSIQITGSDTTHDPGFKGLKFGMSPAETEKRLGKPDRRIEVGEHGTRWEYDGANYSVEIDPEKKLSSIRIVNERTKEPDVKSLPTFRDMVKKLQSGTNAELAELLAPDMEVYEAGKVISFGWPLRTEIAQDKSGVFASIRRLSKELSNVDSSKTEQYEENMRFRLGRDAQHVIKLKKLKAISEIAFTWNGERWQIWEFGTRPAPQSPASWKDIYKPGSLKELVDIRIPDLIKTPNVAMTKSDGKPLASFSYNSYPTSTSVTFTGESRKTAESTLSMISLWLETLGKPKDLAKRFDTEFKFIEKGVAYWLPVQFPLPERFKNEAKLNDDITIYISWVGINFDSGKPELLAIVNEFTAKEK